MLDLLMQLLILKTKEKWWLRGGTAPCPFPLFPCLAWSSGSL